MNNEQKKGQQKNLAQISSESFILILQLRASNDYGELSNLRTRVLELFERFENNGRIAGYDNEKIRLAKFALVAFLDETVICSEWPQKEGWISEPLQIVYFDTFNAGEEFFQNINTLKDKTSINKDVLEIYYLCLSLGFKGKYQLQSPERLRNIIDDLNFELHPEAYRSLDLLSPNGKPKEGIVQTVKFGLPLWVYPVGALAVFLILYIIMSISISARLDEVINYVKMIKI